ncbi:TlpA family protein disulfide reductase [Mangrovimonas xylaniphaga]|uniref:TlpA family protein disulfide reductase n=1 Tax=Mangrovimonas xylaniphaga TaxID=1645915 RepID=UPI0006B6283B|nr:TlpA disulfide reductase family protein [Mangrovimonas xylaniphaga]
MRILQLIIIFLLHTSITSCKENTNKETADVQIENTEPEITINELEHDFKKWWTYHSYNISLSSNFKALNEHSDTIDKKQFLEKLITGNYIPLKLNSNTKFETYKLFKLDSTANESIVNTIKSVSSINFKHFKMEGKSFPKFDLTDLDGNRYTNESTRGKTIILKTWFINCKSCVAEFPELNELVKRYQQKNDILFLSLALDSENELQDFLEGNNFNYQVIANQQEFIKEKLKLQIFPTHIIVDENGTILKVVNKASEMISFIENEKTSSENLPPPSPM